MTIIGVDVSSYQPPGLPWPAWFAFGVRRAHIRASIGYLMDWAYPQHRQQARAAGIKTGVYHALLDHDDEVAQFDPIRAARSFVGLMQPGDELPAAVDVEALGIDDALLWAWITEYERLTDWPLMIYTSQYFWYRLIGHGKTRYSRFPFWIAQYSKPLTLIPDVAVNVTGHQFRYLKGYLPNYANDLDVNEWTVAATPAPAHPTVIRACGKVGPHLNVQGDPDATDWLVRGQPSMGLGINIGPPGEVTQPIFWPARNYENAWNPTDPQRDGYSGEPLPDAQRYADLWYKPFLPLNPWAVIVATPNEPVVHTLAEMAYAAEFMAELVRILHDDYTRTAVVGNWSVGSPDFPLWAAYRPVLVAACKYAAFLGRHSYGPLNEFYALRHRRDNEIFTAMGFPDLPVLLTEMGWENLPEAQPDPAARAWASEPRRTAREYADYLLRVNDQLMLDPYVYGGVAFTHGLNWAQHNLNGSGVGKLMADALQARPVFELAWPQPRVVPPENGEDELSASQRERIEAELVKAESAQAQAHVAIRTIMAEAPGPAVLFQVKVKPGVNLNIRSGPAATFTDIGDLLAGAVEPVFEVAANGWYRIGATEQQWISGNSAYTERLP